MSLPNDAKQKYIETYSHSQLAKQWSISLLTLDAYAAEQGWDREHKLYWADVALEVLKKGAEEHNLVAVKELLRAMGHTRAVGRPAKSEVEKHIAIEAKIANDFEADVSRMKLKSV